jgi:hypothetical protein
MDISVSHLNRRMALQIPAEFPLGLVFVVGVVEVDSALVNTDDLREFYLLEEDHHLLCRLSSRAAEGISLKEGDLIRAGGHIAFDQARARYCLLARDVELLNDYEPSGSPVGELIVVSHQIPDPDLAPAPLPQWVKELAPPEVQEEWVARNIGAASVALIAARESITPDEVEPAAAALAIESWQGFGDGEVNLTYISEEPALAGLSDELIDFLSEAIDSNDVVELTPAILADLSPPDPLAPSPVEDPATAALASDPERAYAAQEASIEEFLSALEAAILADESGSVQQDLDLESKNGQTAPDSLSQSSDSLSHTAADSVPDSQSDPVQQDQTTPVPPAEPEEVLDLPQEQAPVKSEPARARQKSKVLPWFIVLLAILAAILLFAIFAVLLIGADLIPSVAI